jgi:Ser/Thr protein kinase RdoA (MazF antagonist)
MNAVDAISTHQPQIPEIEVMRALAEEFGIHGTLESLVSERDQNYRVTTAAGERFVFKIANSSESGVITEFQIQALSHVMRQGCPVATPEIHRTLAGKESTIVFDGDIPHVCRVVSYLAGTPLSAVSMTPKLVQHFGRCAANLDLALANYEHAGDSQVLLWDLQHAGELRELITYVEEPELRAAVSLCLDDFDRRVQPKLPSLRRQVIHGDLNADNVLVADDRESIVGVIDFGDMVRAPLIMEIAIAAAYLRVGEGDPLSLIAPFITGYNSITALEDVELELLFDLIRARLVATLTILRWRLVMRGKDDDYAQHFLESERSSENFLLRLDTLGRISFTERLRNACNISAS